MDPIDDMLECQRCVTYPNTVKRQFIDGEAHFDFDFDWAGDAPWTTARPASARAGLFRCA